MQNFLGELNLTYCLIYLDDVIVFSKTEEEHLHHLHALCLSASEGTMLKLKPTKCEFFKNKINYLAHHVSKEGVWPSKENLKAVAEFAPPQTYTEIWSLFGLGGTLQTDLLKVLHALHNLYMKHLSGEGASRKNQASDSHRRLR